MICSVIFHNIYHTIPMAVKVRSKKSFFLYYFLLSPNTTYLNGNKLESYFKHPRLYFSNYSCHDSKRKKKYFVSKLPYQQLIILILLILRIMNERENKYFLLQNHKYRLILIFYLHRNKANLRGKLCAQIKSFKKNGRTSK